MLNGLSLLFKGYMPLRLCCSVSRLSFCWRLQGPSRFSIGQWACISLGLEAIVFTYLGLRFRKSWVVSLVVFGSASTLIPCAADRPETLLAVIISRAGAVFALYQLWVFTRPDVGPVFGTDWTTGFLDRADRAPWPL